ncbi:AAA family ATPase [Gloeocapsopsis dulcis]|uniref:AAA+ ATPase domain-containing protein n=1 Tax=Gloeocapsopsis dulcis AAB1 = 1H9 TaxID=1433147 RepID=A0A6N8G3Q4_9CHRO|nr:AAA family ATPase [Gloeocapsopsis dulcis]MUL39484.1 hypothetical protein [Gloeocapsopsis dulcis AAB1 = 1H9]WNN89714.1 AAA family ATPase [Gloeocapsopsis dulcis]
MQYYSNSKSNPSVPDDELFNRIRNSKATISEALAYYEALQTYLLKDPIGDPRYSLIVDQLTVVETILSGIEGALPPKSPPPGREAEFDVSSPEKRNSLERTLRQKSLAEIEAEIIAAATSDNPKLALTKLAAENNAAYSVIQELAKTLLYDRGLGTRYDMDKADYEQCISKIRDLELTIEDPGEKAWKFQSLARDYRRSQKELRESYCKSLIAQHLTEPLTNQEFIDQHGSVREWLVRGWIPKSSLVLLHAQGGIGKTLFVQHLIKHIAMGVDWSEYAINKQGGVLYIQSDTSPLNTIESLKQAGVTPDLPIRFHTDWQIDYTAAMYKWVNKYRPVLVVIDSLTSVSRYSTISENDIEYARPLLYMGDIAREFGCSFIFIHHSNSSNQARGTKGLRNAVDEVWRLEPIDHKDPTNPERLLAMEKSRSRMPMRYRMKLNDDDFSWECLGQENAAGEIEEQNTSARWLIVNHLKKNSGVRFTACDLAYAANVPEATVRRELPGLYREGLINREPNPNYRNGKAEAKHFYLY